MTVLRSLAVVLAIAPLGCSTDGERADPANPPGTEVMARSRLADQVAELDDATYDPGEHRRRPPPVSLRVEALDILRAPVLAVGVAPDGELEVPGPDDVGWYRFGAAPGESGSTVLAAHVAYHGVDGVFRHLDNLTQGDEIEVTTEVGARLVYRVDRLTLHAKEDLPDDVWSRDGSERLVLITCGGSFDDERRRYDSNVVVWASRAS